MKTKSKHNDILIRPLVYKRSKIKEIEESLYFARFDRFIASQIDKGQLALHTVPVVLFALLLKYNSSIGSIAIDRPQSIDEFCARVLSYREKTSKAKSK